MNNDYTTISFTVTVRVKDYGDFDPEYVRDALLEGVYVASKEGRLSSSKDESTEFCGYSVSHATVLEATK